ncbi:BnaA09g46910D [Brassica napus]|uniref:BnaA09g46910D protein n=1 Tax=Brassica napus TaxID=3708 RepID=A0A078GMQ5_BRANA|nr:BnaA09g46910D [Brassica napus]
MMLMIRIRSAKALRSVRPLLLETAAAIETSLTKRD